MAAIKVVVGLSGGVDSAYTASFLKERGYGVRGVFLLMHDSASHAADDARECAARAGVEFAVIDARDEFRRNVTEPFVAEYLKGHTPNPCVDCNSLVKISVLCAYARENGFDRVATGHYARIGAGSDGGYAVFRAKDARKDQSYMLWRLTQDEMSMLITPLSDVFKDDLRARGTEITGREDYKESQDICFIPDGDTASYIERNAHANLRGGNIIDSRGNVIGTHAGIHRYTVGQRRGLGVALGERAFVTGIDAEANTVTLGPPEDLFTDSFSVSQVNGTVHEDCGYTVCTRYRAKPAECAIALDGDRVRVKTKEKLRAVTAGQSAVFYRGDEVCFGGIIE